MMIRTILIALLVSIWGYAASAHHSNESKTITRSCQEKIDTNETIMMLHERLIKGESFGVLAMIYSEDAGTSTTGGDLGWTERGDLVVEYEEVAYNLKINEISAPFLSEYGWHIVQLLDIDGDRIKTKHILIQPKE